MARKPDYRVAAMNKQTDMKSNIGAAWINEDKSISIVLNAFVVISGGKDILITLFPEENK